MSYERITPKDLVEAITLLPNEDMTRILRYIHRLWELENAIESGDLVDTRSYFARRKFILPSGKPMFQICRYDARILVCDSVETRAEAERKVQELNKRKG